MSRPCPVPACTRTMPGHHTVCRACSTELLRDLRDVPSLARHLELAATRQTRLPTTGGTLQRPDPEERGAEIGLTIRRAPLPWDERARLAEHALQSTLAERVRALQHGVHPYPGPTCRTCTHRSCTYLSLGRPPATLAAMAAWLIRHRAQLLGRADTAEAVTELRAAVARVHRLIEPADQMYAGPCDQCGADLYARPGAPTAACRVCVDDHGRRLRYLVAQRRGWMLAEVEELLLPAPDVARALTSLVRPIAPALLYTWVARRRLTPRTTDGRGRALFRVGDVLELMQPITDGLPGRSPG